VKESEPLLLRGKYDCVIALQVGRGGVECKKDIAQVVLLGVADALWPVNVRKAWRIAHAAARSLGVIIDDTKARRICREQHGEVGELFKAVRKSSGMKVDPLSPVSSVGEELAEITNFVGAIANRFQVDLETAYRNKEERNRTRVWC